LQTLLTPESAHYRDEDGKTVLMLAAEIGESSVSTVFIAKALYLSKLHVTDIFTDRKRTFTQVSSQCMGRSI
jgi:hypothetical protein